MVLLWILATVRYVFVGAEQPGSSVMPCFPYLVFFKKIVSKFFPWSLVRLSGAHLYEYELLDSQHIKISNAYGTYALHF